MILGEVTAIVLSHDILQQPVSGMMFLCLQEGKETLSSVNATGIAMLFSAGTFLYVATVHVLPELTSRSSHSHGGSIIETTERKGLRTIELMFLIIGALLPLLLTLGHQH
jgi:zinc transporter 9